MKYFYPDFNLDLFMMTYGVCCGGEKVDYMIMAWVSIVLKQYVYFGSIGPFSAAKFCLLG